MGREAETSKMGILLMYSVIFLVAVGNIHAGANDEDPNVVVDGNTTNFLFIFLCDPKSSVPTKLTGAMTNIKVFKKEAEAEGLKALEEAKSRGLPVISIPCDGKMKIEGDATDMVLVVGKPKAN